MSADQKDPVSILANTISEQGRAASAQAAALGGMHKAVDNTQSSVNEVKSLVGMIKDRIEELQRALDGTERDHKEIGVAIGAAKHAIDRLINKMESMVIVTRDEINNIVAETCRNVRIAPDNCPNADAVSANGIKDALRSVRSENPEEKKALLQESVREVINERIPGGLKLLANKWFLLGVAGLFALLVISVVFLSGRAQHIQITRQGVKIDGKPAVVSEKAK